MSELFKKVQDGLRHFKMAHGVDLNFRHGVMLGDKMYPAYNKYHFVGSEESETDPTVGFSTPFENGHNALVHVRHNGKIDANLMVPFYFQRDHAVSYGYGPASRMLFPNEGKYYVRADTFDSESMEHFHKTLLDWSRQEQIGVYRDMNQESDNEDGSRFMTKEEINEHRKNYKQQKNVNNVDSKTISVYAHHEVDIPTRYDYDIVTERLIKKGTLDDYNSD